MGKMVMTNVRKWLESHGVILFISYSALQMSHPFTVLY